MLVEFSVFPTGKEVGLSEEVAKVIKIVKESGLDYQLTSMGTIIEGDWDQVMEVIKKSHFLLRDSYSRVENYIRIDDQVGKTNRLAGKVKSVKEKL